MGEWQDDMPACSVCGGVFSHQKFCADRARSQLATAQARIIDLETQLNAQRVRTTALADEWNAVWERWKNTNDGPRVSIFRVHANKVRGLNNVE